MLTEHSSGRASVGRSGHYGRPGRPRGMNGWDAAPIPAVSCRASSKLAAGAASMPAVASSTARSVRRSCPYIPAALSGLLSRNRAIRAAMLELPSARTWNSPRASSGSPVSSRRKPSSWRSTPRRCVRQRPARGERCVEVCAGLVEPVSLVRDDAEQRPAGADDLRHVRRGGRVECLGEQPPGQPEVVLSLMDVAPLEELQDPLTLVHTSRLAHPTAPPYLLRPSEGDRLVAAASQYSSKVQQCPRCSALYSGVRPHSAQAGGHGGQEPAVARRTVKAWSRL
jgi:hypothetical protein